MELDVICDGLQITKAATSKRISVVRSAPLLFYLLSVITTF